MNYDLLFILSFSVLIAAAIALIKFSNIKKSYYPFIYVIWLASFNEVLSYFLIQNGKFNVLNSNIYCLLESLLLLWFFRNIGNFKKYKNLPYLLGTIFIIAWVIENFFINSIDKDYTSWFILIYSFPVVLMSINAINLLLFKEKELLTNPLFLICIGFIVFFTYRIVVEVFWMYGLLASSNFAVRVYHILSFVNLLSNLIYALAILWMKKKHAFTLQF